MASAAGATGIRPIVKPQVRTLVPYSPGKPIHEVQQELGLSDVIKLASNENPWGPAPHVVEAIRAAVPDIGLYPDGGAMALRQALAEKHGVGLEQLCVGNGSDEILQLLGYAVLDQGDELIIADPTFARYEPQAILNQAVAVKVPLKDYVHDVDAMAAAVTDRTKAIFVANPANPAGTYVPDTAIERMLNAVPESVLVVLDEAYDEFVDDADHGRSVDLALARPNVVVLRTFSKIHALAALRIGYSLANADITTWLHQVREPFNTSSLAQVAALAALQDDAHAARTIETNAAGRRRYAAACARLGLQAVPSQANFVLIEVGDAEQKLYQGLLRRGIIVRACTPIGFPGHLRVTVGTPEQCDRFIAGLEAELGE